MKTKLLVFLTLALTTIGLTASINDSMNSAAANSPFVGTWQTKWQRATDKTIATAPITVRTDSGKATDLDGTVEVPGANGAMFGSLSADGKTWSGNWWNPDGVRGTFTFTLRGVDGKSFSGSYTQVGADGKFDWSGTR